MKNWKSLEFVCVYGHYHPPPVVTLSQDFLSLEKNTTNVAVGLLNILSTMYSYIYIVQVADFKNNQTTKNN